MKEEERKKAFQEGVENEKEYQRIMERKAREGKVEYDFSFLKLLATVSGIMIIVTGMKTCSDQKQRIGELSKFHPTNAHLEYVNKDSLPDLVYNIGEIYFQTKEGKFVSYSEALAKEKAKIDSIYQAKADSLKRVYENKLEKEVK